MPDARRGSTQPASEVSTKPLDLLYADSFCTSSLTHVYQESKATHMAAKTGTVKRLVSEKGFGFIVANDNAAEYFFHSSACASEPFDSLREGQNVTFDVGLGPKGPRAENVRVV